MLRDLAGTYGRTVRPSSGYSRTFWTSGGRSGELVEAMVVGGWCNAWWRGVDRRNEVQRCRARRAGGIGLQVPAGGKLD